MKKVIEYDRDYTREEVVELMGEELVKQAEKDNCTEYRVSFAYTEYHGYSDETPDGDRVVAVYYQLNDDVKQEMKTVGDLSGLDWEIHHYRIG